MLQTGGTKPTLDNYRFTAAAAASRRSSFRHGLGDRSGFDQTSFSGNVFPRSQLRYAIREQPVLLAHFVCACSEDAVRLSALSF